MSVEADHGIGNYLTQQSCTELFVTRPGKFTPGERDVTLKLLREPRFSQISANSCRCGPGLAEFGALSPKQTKPD